MPTSSTCLHNSFYKMLPSIILGYCFLSFPSLTPSLSSPLNPYSYHILVYFGSKYFHENAPNSFCKKNIFMNNPCGQEKGVAWQRCCEINFRDKAEKCKSSKNISPPKWTRIQYIILLLSSLFPPPLSSPGSITLY